LSNVDTGEDETFRQRDIAPRLSTPVNAKRHTIRGPRRYHTEAPIVVDMLGAQGQAGKLPYEVRLLIGEGRSREQCKGVSAVLGLNAADTVLDAVERLGPVGLAKPVRATHKWCQEPVRVAALEVALDPFGTEHATVHRELLPGLETDNRVLLNLELDPTLHAAKATMCLDETVRLSTPLPSTRWSVVEMGTILLGES